METDWSRLHDCQSLITTKDQPENTSTYFSLNWRVGRIGLISASPLVVRKLTNSSLRRNMAKVPTFAHRADAAESFMPKSAIIELIFSSNVSDRFGADSRDARRRIRHVSWLGSRYHLHVMQNLYSDQLEHPCSRVHSRLSTEVCS
jgi:hypothetical protein